MPMRCQCETWASRGTIASLAVIIWLSISVNSLSVCAQQLVKAVDEALPVYIPNPALAGGTLKAVGSETMSNMMKFWADGFSVHYPGVVAEIDSKGSSNALPSLIAGQANVGLMSRSPKQSELSAFKNRYGYLPIILPSSIDLLVVYVHRHNPLESLSFPELDAIFSSTRLYGARRRAAKWGDFTEVDSFAGESINCFGRNAASGTYGYFKDRVLRKGDYGPWVNELNGSAMVVQAVGSDRAAIGYSGIGFNNANVKTVALSEQRGGEAIRPDAEAAYSGQYPLTRYLYIVINKDPRRPLDLLQSEFVRYVFSRQGQTQVLRDGYIPLKAGLAERVLNLAGIAESK